MRIGILGLALAGSAAGCGSCGGDDSAIDAPLADAPVADAHVVDGPVADAPGIDGVVADTRTGSISVLDVSVLDHPELGHGGLIDITYTPVPNVFPVYDDRDAQGFGCAAWVYDISDGMVPVSVDEGTVTITGGTAGIPACVWDGGMGYYCPAGSGSGGAGDSIADDPGGAGTGGLVDSAPSGYTFNSEDTGRYIWITGATTFNNGRFPVVGVNTGTNSIIYANPQALDQGTFVGSYLVYAGGGPVPTGPEFLADGDEVTVSLAPGGGNHVQALQVTANTGDLFALDAASETGITSVPFDGSAITLRCASGQCADGAVTMVDIATTDGDPGAGPEYGFPDPVDRSARIQCLAAGGEITVPSGAMFAVMSASPNRIRTTFARAGVASEQNGDGSNPTQVLIGHAIIGYSDPPAPPADAGVDADPNQADASPPDAFVCSDDLAPASDGSTAALRALVISEVNPGDYIELYNNTASAIALGSNNYQFCNPFNYCDLSSLAAGVTVPAHGYATVPWPSAGSGCFANFSGVTDAGGEFILYVTGATHSATDIMDYVCWGTNSSFRKSQAEGVGKWSGACAGAITGGSLHRIIGSTGVTAASYNLSDPPTPMNCTP
ncbi:MAG TPA: hypothetical protein VL172_17045 [Kofleriaceae bacterium]|nr:hypothetical protein [Kofleriaceae bacterium]